jgi:hypothetical protein
MDFEEAPGQRPGTGVGVGDDDPIEEAALLQPFQGVAGQNAVGGHRGDALGPGVAVGLAAASRVPPVWIMSS